MHRLPKALITRLDCLCNAIRAARAGKTSTQGLRATQTTLLVLLTTLLLAAGALTGCTTGSNAAEKPGAQSATQYALHSDQEPQTNNSSADEDNSENPYGLGQKPNVDHYTEYVFRNNVLLKDHYYKHGHEMGFHSADAYEEAASNVANNPRALHKIEAEDGDDLYYLEDTNEFVCVSTDGYLRTYFCPDTGKHYFDRK